MNLGVLAEAIKIAAVSGHVPVCAVGGTGIGKTSLVNQFSTKGVPVIVFRPDQVPAEDIQGIPHRKDDEYFAYLKPWWWPSGPAPEVTFQIAGIPKIFKQPFGIICIDEFNRAKDDRRQALFQLLSERRIGSHPLPAGWQVVMCINPDTDEYSVHPLDKATRGRCMFVPVEFSLNTWIRWADTKSHIPEFAKKFMREHGLPKEKIDIQDYPVPQPRTFEWLCHITSVIGTQHRMLRTCAVGLVGHAHADAFMEFAGAGVERLPSYQDFRKMPEGEVIETATRWTRDGRADLMSSLLKNIIEGLRKETDPPDAQHGTISKLFKLLIHGKRDFLVASIDDLITLPAVKQAILRDPDFQAAWDDVYGEVKRAHR